MCWCAPAARVVSLVTSTSTASPMLGPHVPVSQTQCQVCTALLRQVRIAIRYRSVHTIVHNIGIDSVLCVHLISFACHFQHSSIPYIRCTLVPVSWTVPNRWLPLPLSIMTGDRACITFFLVCICCDRGSLLHRSLPLLSASSICLFYLPLPCVLGMSSITRFPCLTFTVLHAVLRAGEMLWSVS